MANGLLAVTMILAALAALLAGIAAFSGNRPPDARINQVMDEMEEIKSLIMQMQKSVIQMERKNDKDAKDFRNELKELLERMADKIDKRFTELAG
jgi:hypothetical protein